MKNYVILVSCLNQCLIKFVETLHESNRSLAYQITTKKCFCDRSLIYFSWRNIFYLLRDFGNFLSVVSKVFFLLFRYDNQLPHFNAIIHLLFCYRQRFSALSRSTISQLILNVPVAMSRTYETLVWKRKSNWRNQIKLFFLCSLVFHFFILCWFLFVEKICFLRNNKYAQYQHYV